MERLAEKRITTVSVKQAQELADAYGFECYMECSSLLNVCRSREGKGGKERYRRWRGERERRERRGKREEERKYEKGYHSFSKTGPGTGRCLWL
jgi:hypothetical protein